MRPLRNIFYKLSRTEQRREGVAAYLWPGQTPVDGQSRLRPGHPAMAAESPHGLAESVDETATWTRGNSAGGTVTARI